DDHLKFPGLQGHVVVIPPGPHPGGGSAHGQPQHRVVNAFRVAAHHPQDGRSRAVVVHVNVFHLHAGHSQVVVAPHQLHHAQLVFQLRVQLGREFSRVVQLLHDPSPSSSPTPGRRQRARRPVGGARCATASAIGCAKGKGPTRTGDSTPGNRGPPPRRSAGRRAHGAGKGAPVDGGRAGGTGRRQGSGHTARRHVVQYGGP